MSDYRVLKLEDIVAVVLIRAVGDGWLLDDPVLGDDDVIRGRCLVGADVDMGTGMPIPYGGVEYSYSVALDTYAVTLVEVDYARVAS